MGRGIERVLRREEREWGFVGALGGWVGGYDYC